MHCRSCVPIRFCCTKSKASAEVLASSRVFRAYGFAKGRVRAVMLAVRYSHETGILLMLCAAAVAWWQHNEKLWTSKTELVRKLECEAAFRIPGDLRQWRPAARPRDLWRARHIPLSRLNHGGVLCADRTRSLEVSSPTNPSASSNAVSYRGASPG